VKPFLSREDVEEAISARLGSDELSMYLGMQNTPETRRIVENHASNILRMMVLEGDLPSDFPTEVHVYEDLEDPEMFFMRIPGLDVLRRKQ
jgi:hypothetical protein